MRFRFIPIHCRSTASSASLRSFSSARTNCLSLATLGLTGASRRTAGILDQSLLFDQHATVSRCSRRPSKPPLLRAGIASASERVRAIPRFFGSILDAWVIAVFNSISVSSCEYGRATLSHFLIGPVFSKQPKSSMNFEQPRAGPWSSDHDLLLVLPGFCRQTVLRSEPNCERSPRESARAGDARHHRQRRRCHFAESTFSPVGKKQKNKL